MLRSSRVRVRGVARLLPVCLLCCFAAWLPVSPVAAAEAIFDVISFPNPGRSIAARIADFNGDGRADLMVVAVEGMPPNEERQVRVFLQGEDGSLRASLDVGRRSNYYVIPRAGLISAESDIRLFIDVPKVAVGDVDGDGRVDIVSSTRHDIRVFLRRADDSFASAPDRSIPLGLVTRRDHICGTGSVSSEFRDFNADGVLDLLMSGKGDALEIFLGGGDAPFSRRSARQRMPTAGVIGFADFDGDGLTDFVLFDPHNFDVPVQLAINTGALATTGRIESSRQSAESRSSRRSSSR